MIPAALRSATAMGIGLRGLDEAFGLSITFTSTVSLAARSAPEFLGMPKKAPARLILGGAGDSREAWLNGRQADSVAGSEEL